jgi:hypothetical protein
MKLNINYLSLVRLANKISICIALFFFYKNCEYDFDMGFHFSLYLPPVQAIIVLWFLCDAIGLAWLNKKRTLVVDKWAKIRVQKEAESM